MIPAPPDRPDLDRLHPADLADRLQRLPPDEAGELLRHLPPTKAGAVLAEMEPAHLPKLLPAFPAPQLAAILPGLPPADSADLLQRLPAASRREVLAALPADTAEAVRTLLRYPEDSAGGIMSTRFIALRDNLTVEQVRDLLRAHAEEERPEDVSYLYVVDAHQRLAGIVSLRDLVFSPAGRRLEEIMKREVHSVPAQADQEELARQFARYHYMGLPVVEPDGRLAGVVRASDLLEVAEREATEDMQLMVGLSGEERATTAWPDALRLRLPWLYVNLATAFLAALVVGLFEDTIARWTTLAIFLPIVAGQAGNAGMQTLTVVIRDLALGELDRRDWRRLLGKETLLGLCNGLAVGLVVGLIAWGWHGRPILGLVAAGAMLLAQVAAGVSGVVIPLGLKLARLDPALAASIFVTTVTDVAGFLFFLGLATLALPWAGIPP